MTSPLSAQAFMDKDSLTHAMDERLLVETRRYGEAYAVDRHQVGRITQAGQVPVAHMGNISVHNSNRALADAGVRPDPHSVSTGMDTLPSSTMVQDRILPRAYGFCKPTSRCLPSRRTTTRVTQNSTIQPKDPCSDMEGT
jgi:hypothetical protein